MLALVVSVALGLEASAPENLFETAFAPPKRGLFENAFPPVGRLGRGGVGAEDSCTPHIARWTPFRASTAARKALNKGVLIANDKSKGSGWMIQLGFKKSLRYDIPFPGGNHETAVSPCGKYIAVPHYETPTYNSTEGGGQPGSAASIVELHTGRARVLPMSPNPWAFTEQGVPVAGGVHPKPHDATFTPSGDLLLTSQVADSIVKVDMTSGDVTAFALRATGCSTPHLVRTVPSKSGRARFAVTGCRGTNADTPSDYVGRLALIDLVSGDVRALKTPGGKWNEGITVTAAGEVWVGSLNEHFLTVFGWPNATCDGEVERRLDNFGQIAKIPIRFPLRFAYDSVTDRVAVATINLDAVLRGDTSDSGLHVFDAKTKQLVKRMTLRTERGVINSEGLRAGPGFFYTGGFDTQAVVVVDSAYLTQIAEILLPRCSLPEGQCTPQEYMPNRMTANGTAAGEAKKRGLSGWNNWSGGLCKATGRGPFDRRFTVLDGFNYSPVFPAWAWL